MSHVPEGHPIRLTVTTTDDWHVFQWMVVPLYEHWQLGDVYRSMYEMQVPSWTRYRLCWGGAYLVSRGVCVSND